MAMRLKQWVLMVIVLMIVLIFSACGLRWRLRMSGAEGSLRKIENAEKDYKARMGRYGSLPELSSAGHLTGDLSKGIGDGYRYEIKVKNNSYEAHALPDKSVDKKLPAFLIDQSGVMHISELEATEATMNDPSPSEK